MFGRVCMGLLLLSLTSGFAQENLFSRYFNLYSGIVPGVDFLAASREEVKAFEQPITEARQKLQVFLGEDLPRGAIFVCSNAEQRDSVYEPRAQRMGYRWILIVLSPQIEVQQMMERMRARMGGDIPPERMERFLQRSSGMQSQLIAKVAQELGYAVLMTTLAPEREFRTSRLDDMNRSPLADWLDIGLASHAAGTLGPQLSHLKRHMAESYPIEDILFMSRPVIVPSFVDAGSEPPSPGFTPPPMGAGVPGSPQPRPPQAQQAVPKDVQDRMMYDAQATTLFAHLLEKLGTDKLKQIIARNRKDGDVQAILESPEFLGPDMEAVENDWLSWVENHPLGSGRGPDRGSPPRDPGRGEGR